jgi:hypothetical protein
VRYREIIDFNDFPTCIDFLDFRLSESGDFRVNDFFDFQKANDYRLCRLSAERLSTFSTFDFPCAYMRPGGQKNTPIQSGLGYLSNIRGAGTVSAAVVDMLRTVTRNAF